MAMSLTKVMNGTAEGLALLQALADNSFDSVLITDASGKLKIIYAKAIACTSPSFNSLLSE